MKFRGQTLTIISEDEKSLKFSWNGKEYKFDKSPIEIDAYDNTWGGAQENTIWDTIDGKVVIVATKGYDPSCTEDGDVTPNDAIMFPKAKDIFSNEDILNSVLSYRMEYESYGWYEDILDGLTLQDVLEGLWVESGQHIVVCDAFDCIL